MKQFLKIGVQVLDKSISMPDEKTTLRKMLLAGQGFSTRVEVSEKAYGDYNVGDVAIMAYAPSSANQKIFGSDKTVKGFEPKFMGLQKLDSKSLKKYFELEEIELSIVSKKHEPIVINQDKLDSGEDTEKRIYDYCTVGTSGLVSGIFKVNKDEYDKVDIHKSYKANIRPDYEKGKLMLTLFNFVEVGEIKDLEGFDM